MVFPGIIATNLDQPSELYWRALWFITMTDHQSYMITGSSMALIEFLISSKRSHISGSSWHILRAQQEPHTGRLSEITKYILQIKFHFRMVTLTSSLSRIFLSRGIEAPFLEAPIVSWKQNNNDLTRNEQIYTYSNANYTAETIIATNQNFLPTDSIFDLIEEKQLFRTPRS